MGKDIWLRPDITTSQDLSSAALSYTTSIGKKFKLEEINFKFDGAVSETITITRISAAGSSYDTQIGGRTLVSKTNYVFRPDGEANFQAGEEIKIECTDANGLRIVYVTIKTSELFG